LTDSRPVYFLSHDHKMSCDAAVSPRALFRIFGTRDCERKRKNVIHLGESQEVNYFAVCLNFDLANSFLIRSDDATACKTCQLDHLGVQ